MPTSLAMCNASGAMKDTLAFDVYGTLIDTAGVVERLESMVGDRAGEFAGLWREKQLEYSFRRGLMRLYEDFAVCVRDSLDYACARLDAPLTEAEREGLLAAYRALPAFDDARACLESPDMERFEVCAFSNGSAATVDGLLRAADIRRFFRQIVSVEAVRSFKPDPAVYRHFLEASGAAGDFAWLVSGNPFDVMGAIAAGMHGIWVRRAGSAPFDPWGIEPTLTVTALTEVVPAIVRYRARV